MHVHVSLRERLHAITTFGSLAKAAARREERQCEATDRINCQHPLWHHFNTAECVAKAHDKVCTVVQQQQQ